MKCGGGSLVTDTIDSLCKTPDSTDFDNNTIDSAKPILLQMTNTMASENNHTPKRSNIKRFNNNSTVSSNGSGCKSLTIETSEAIEITISSQNELNDNGSKNKSITSKKAINRWSSSSPRNLSIHSTTNAAAASTKTTRITKPLHHLLAARRRISSSSSRSSPPGDTVSTCHDGKKNNPSSELKFHVNETTVQQSVSNTYDNDNNDDDDKVSVVSLTNDFNELVVVVRNEDSSDNNNNFHHHCKKKDNTNTTWWSPLNGTGFRLRACNYSRLKQKASSDTCLYDVVYARAFRSNKLTRHASASSSNDDNNNISVPKEIIEMKDRDGDRFILDQVSLPHLLVINFQFPLDAPSLMIKSNDSPNGSSSSFVELLLYLKPSIRLIEEVKKKRSSIADCPPAIQLFHKWCTGVHDFEIRSRFKTFGYVHNLKKYNLGWLSSYNGKPALVTKSGSAFRGRAAESELNYIHLDVNVNMWSYIAKKGMNTLYPKLKEMAIDIGFTIEGREDNELPECTLGAFTLKEFDYTNLPAY